ncbi:MAG: hypothetical protein EPO21_23850 [Chloroflexota bacterium]|nr:MAG: hypothetical protein EPO21_23850 [Chloroflexota bacterium]
MNVYVPMIVGFLHRELGQRVEITIDWRCQASRPDGQRTSRLNASFRRSTPHCSDGAVRPPRQTAAVSETAAVFSDKMPHLRNHAPDLRNQRGVIAPTVALLMFVLLGFSALVTDVGLVYSVRRQMQNAVDMAALAGANQLLTDALTFESLSMRQAITDNAAGVATANGIATGELEPLVFSYRNLSARLNPTITVAAHRDVNLLFASVLGFSSQRVRVEATSVIGRLRPFGLWPWGVTQDSLVYNQELSLKVGARQNATGNFMALDFDREDQTGGARSYQKYIRNKFNGAPPAPVPPNTWSVPTETGNMVGPTRDPVMDLLGMPACTYGTDIRCPRIGLVPVLQAMTWNEVAGKSEVVVVDFAIFRLDSWDNGGTGRGNDTVRGQFLTYAKGVGGVQAFDTDLSGLLGARLLR